IHSVFLMLKQKKMSTSLGNFVTIRKVLSKGGGEVVRFCVLKEQYRKDVEYDADCFQITKDELDSIHGAIAKAKRASTGADGDELLPAVERGRGKFFEAMGDGC